MNTQDPVTELNDLSYADRVLNTAGEAAKLTLQYGGGAHRAEEVYTRICAACGIFNAQISAQSTSLSATVSADGISNTAVFRVSRRGVNLKKLDMINTLSRALSSDSIDIYEAEKRLIGIKNQPTDNLPLSVLSAGLSSAFFALLLSGTPLDFVLTAVIGAIISLVLSFFERAGAYSFMNNLFGGIIDAGLAILASLALSRFGLSVGFEPVIVGAMMPLLPGLATTNAIRDIINGDYVSGTASVMEALSMAIALAAGVALSFGVFAFTGVNA